MVVAKIVKTGSKHASDTACASDFSDEPFDAKAGEELTILARNNGPDAVTELDVHVDQVLDGLEIVDVICDRGVTPDPVFCEYVDLNPANDCATATVRIVGRRR